MGALTKAVFLLAAFLIAGLPMAHSFPASGESSSQLGRGTYLVQEEGKRAEICHSQSKIVDDISTLDPDVKIVRHDHPSGKSYLVVYLSNTGGIVMPIDPAKFICAASPLTPIQAFMVREMADDPANKIEVIPVWPQQEE